MKKIIILMILFCFPLVVKSVTRDEFREAVANVSISAGTTYKDEFVYSYFWDGTVENPIDISKETTTLWLKNAYNGIKSSGKAYGFKSSPGVRGTFKDKFAVFCESFVRLMMYHASGGVLDYHKDFERVSVSELRRGDFIHFPNHIAIYIDNANDNSDWTYTVVEASTTIRKTVINNKADYGYRIKDSALAKINYNQVMASYDFHDRLDDEPPVINGVKQVEDKILINATDYKKYELVEKSDILEPENNGIVGYQITKTNVEPTEWKKINRTDKINNEYPGVSTAGTYYVWVIDVGGNVASKQLIAQTVVKDKHETGKLKYTIKNSRQIDVTIENASDSDGIKLYRYYLNNELIRSSSQPSYTFTNLESNTNYSIHYEIVDDKNNVYKSNTYNVTTPKNIIGFSLIEEDITIKTGEAYQIKAKVSSYDNNYKITYKDYNENIVSVNTNGIVIGKNEGITIIKVSAEDYTRSLKVTVKNDESAPNEPGQIISFWLKEEQKQLKIGEKYQIEYIIEPGNVNHVVEYSDYDNTIIAVDPNGLVSALKEGTTIVKATAENLTSAITIKVLPSSSKPNKEEINVPNGDEKTEENNDVKKTPHGILITAACIAGALILIKLVYMILKKEKHF